MQMRDQIGSEWNLKLIIQISEEVELLRAGTMLDILVNSGMEIPIGQENVSEKGRRVPV
jgi:hypothetical protein